MIFELLTDLAVNKIKKEVVEKVAKTAVAKTAVKATEKLATDEAARRIIRKGIEDIADLTKSVKIGKNTYIEQRVKLADVKDAINKLDTKERYTKKDIEKLRKSFNKNRLKGSTYQYINIGVDRIIINDTAIDKTFNRKILIGTVNQSPLTKVKNLAKEINKTLKGYNTVSIGAQEQISDILKQVDIFIKDPLDFTKGINIANITEKDADKLIKVLQQISEIGELPRNIETRRALSEWEDETADEVDDIFNGAGIDYISSSDISIYTLADELDRMQKRLRYDSDEERITNIGFSEFRQELGSVMGYRTVKDEFMKEVYQLFRTNRLPTPNIRGKEMYGKIDRKTYEFTIALNKAISKKTRELKRG